MSVCPFDAHAFLLQAGPITNALILPAGKGGQQLGTLSSGTENVHLMRTRAQRDCIFGVGRDWVGFYVKMSVLGRDWDRFWD
jgi:hypothetical protein